MFLQSGYGLFCAGQSCEESKKGQNPALQNSHNWHKAVFPTPVSRGSTRLYYATQDYCLLHTAFSFVLKYKESNLLLGEEDH